MESPTRIKRVALIALAVLGIAFVVAFAAIVVGLVSAIAFSGSTGSAYSDFSRQYLEPPFHFLAGAVAAGGAISVINAAVTGRSTWTKSILVGSLAGGVAAVMNPSLGKALLKVPLTIVGKIFQLLNGL